MFAEWRMLLCEWLLVEMADTDVTEDFKCWRKAMEKVFKNLLGMYEMLDRQLELLENEKVDRAKVMEQNLEGTLHKQSDICYEWTQS